MTWKSGIALMSEMGTGETIPPGNYALAAHSEAGRAKRQAHATLEAIQGSAQILWINSWMSPRGWTQFLWVNIL